MSQPAFDLELDDPADPTYSVRELAEALNITLDRGFRDGVWVRGEIQGFQQRGTGHIWFNLTEDGDEGKATIAVVLFAGAAARLLPVLRRHRIRLEDGITVRIHGRLDFYAPSGRLTLVMDQLDARFTLGQLAAQRDQLLRTLVAGGLLDRNRQLPMPLVPLKVGVVTSKDSAAWHDFRSELWHSRLAFRVRVADVRVQGAGAEHGIATAIEELGRSDVDVVVVVRGGGSRTDLAVFDTEVVARAIAAAPVPVLTGLGHEVDRSVADEVAHSSWKTPTACAAALVDRVLEYRNRLDFTGRAIGRRAAVLADRTDAGLRATSRRIAERAGAATELAGQRLDHHAERLRREAGVALTSADRRVVTLERRAGVLDPAATLARGWSITRLADGRVVRSAGEARDGDLLMTTLADGTVASRVEAST